MINKIRGAFQWAGASRTSVTMAVAAGLLMWHGEDAAEVLAMSVGHEWRDIVVTKVVKLAYVVSGLFVLALGLKPLYHLADNLTHYDTSIEIEKGRSLGPAIVMASIISAYLLGGVHFLGLGISTVNG